MRRLLERNEDTNRIKRPRKEDTSSSLNNIPSDLLLYLCLFLDLGSSFKMKELSWSFNAKMENILQQMLFWNFFPGINITPEHCISIGKRGFNNLVHHTAAMTDQKIDQNYFERYKPSGHLKGPITYCSMRAAWKLGNVQALILKDQANCILKKVTSLSGLASYVAGYNFDHEAIARFIILRNTRVEELAFIGLIPILIQHKASHSFKLFIKVYLGVHACVEFKIQAVYSFLSMWNLILQGGDDHYVNGYIDLVIKNYPVKINNCLYEQIDFFCKNGKTEQVLHHINTAPQKRKDAILLQYKKTGLNMELLNKMYLEEQPRYALYESLKNALVFLEKNTHLREEDIIAYKNKIAASFDLLMEEKPVHNSEVNNRFW